MSKLAKEQHMTEVVQTAMGYIAENRPAGYVSPNERSPQVGTCKSLSLSLSPSLSLSVRLPNQLFIWLPRPPPPPPPFWALHLPSLGRCSQFWFAALRFD